jgi:hypothetical protein
MYIAYMVYQAERPMSAAEQREAYRAAGELASSLGSLWRSVTAPLRWARRAGDWFDGLMRPIRVAGRPWATTGKP